VDLAAFADALDKLAGELEDGAQKIADKFAPKFLAEFKRVTPVRSGALQDSEDSEITGGGGSAGVVVRTHLPLYASFRNNGGDIEPRHTYVDKRTGKEHMGFLHFEGVFTRHVHQFGAHYREKTIEWAEGELPAYCQEVIREIMESAGL
jgi:hypothetical protein